MKNKDEIKQEIYKLAKSIPDTSSEDLLLTTARELYEKAVLLKHLNDSAFQTITRNDERIILVSKETIPSEIQPVAVEKKTVTIDLFSSEVVSSEIPVPDKTALKESKDPKKRAGESVADKLQHKKITDLKSSIGINEKFQFINQLFEGNMKEYNVAIDQINSFNSQAEAESYLANLQGIYKWKGEEPAALNLLELVQRRFL